MNRTLRIILLLWAVLILAIAAGAQAPSPAQDGARAEEAKTSPPAPSAVKSEAPAPSPALLRVWAQLESVVELRAAEMRRREQAIEQLTQAQIAISSFNGQLERLSAEFRKLLPEGYRWEPASKSLVKIAAEKPSADSSKPKQEEPK